MYGLREERELPKLFDAHVYPDQIEKMSVHHCTEVISNITANYIRKLIQRNGNYEQLIQTQIAQIIFYF